MKKSNSVYSKSCFLSKLKWEIPYVICFIFILFLLTGCSEKHNRAFDKYTQYEGEINQHTRLIQAERHRIFDILTHQDSFNNICPKGTNVTFGPKLPYQVGTIVNTKINHIFKLHWKSQVIEIKQHKKIRLQFLSGFFAGGSEIWEFVSENGFTRATHTIIVQPQGFLKKLAWNLKVRRKHNKMVKAFLDNLKLAAETE